MGIYIGDLIVGAILQYMVYTCSVHKLMGIYMGELILGVIAERLSARHLILLRAR